MLKEIFKDIKGYEGLYQVSNLGRVRSLKRRNAGERFLVLLNGSAGYSQVRLSKNGVAKTKNVHCLVAQAFIPNPKNLPEVNHKKGIKVDNRATQLEWCTSGENAKHAFKIGLRVGPCGEKQGSSKLNEAQVRVIKHLKNIKPKMLQREIAKVFNVTNGAISLIHLGKRWNHITI